MTILLQQNNLEILVNILIEQLLLYNKLLIKFLNHLSWKVYIMSSKDNITNHKMIFRSYRETLKLLSASG